MKQLFIGALTLILLIINGPIHAQITPDQPSSGFTPPNMNATPSAPGLGQNPVNLSTGAAMVNIPLYNLQSKTLSMPISLSYNSMGVKVNERASWVGTGWSLNMGGVISRNVVGLPDEVNSNPNVYDVHPDGRVFGGMPNGGYFENADEIPASVDLADDSQENVAKRTIVGRLDLQPDEFYFSFFGRSGMFMLDANLTAHLMPFQSLKIHAADYDLSSFTITDENGYVFEFAQREITAEMSDECGDDFLKNFTEGVASSWYLTRITNAIGEEEFVFVYEENSQTSETIQLYKFRNDYTGSLPIELQSLEDERTCQVTFKSKMLHPISISFMDQLIEFNKGAERIDLDNDFTLSSISFKQSQQLVSSYHFNYSYSGNTDDRLFLDNIFLTNANAETQLMNTFAYNGPSLPGYDFEAVDHWGYFNSMLYPDLLPKERIGILGGTRKVNGSAVMAGSLLRITDRHGASTTFAYEPNTYSQSNNELVTGLNLNQDVTFNCSIEVDDSDYYSYIQQPPGGLQFSNPNCGGPIFVGQQQPLECLLNIPTENCNLAYTFYDPTDHNSQFDEPNGENIFDINDMDDHDRPTNIPTNTDEISLELCYMPAVKEKVQQQIFYLEFGQTIQLSGSISPTYCPSYTSSIKIIDMEDLSVVWTKEGNATSLVEFDESEYFYLAGKYKVVCTIYHPEFEDVYDGYVPMNFPFDDDTYASIDISLNCLPAYPSANEKYAGGLRIKSITIDDGDDDHTNDIIKRYDYHDFNDNSRSSGYLITEIDYSKPGQHFMLRDNTPFSPCNDFNDIYFNQTNHNWLTSEFNSQGVRQLQTTLGGYVIYRNVTEYQTQIGSDLANGRTEYTFSFEPSAESDEYVNEPIENPGWLRGSPLCVRNFSEADQLITEEFYSYETSAAISSVVGMKTGITSKGWLLSFSNPYGTICGYDNGYKWRKYEVNSYLQTTSSSTQRAYDQSDPIKFTESITTYTYESVIPSLPSKLTTETSDPLKPFTVQKIKYVGDYVVSANGDDMTTTLNYLINEGEFGLNTPVETITLQGTSLNNLKVIGGTLNTFKIVGGKVVPDATYKLELAAPLNDASFTMSSVSGIEFVFEDELYRKIAHVAAYDEEERPICSQKENDILTSVIRDYADGRVVAEVINATPEKCAYTSFETENEGGWNFDIAGCIQIPGSVKGISFDHGKTGSRFFDLNYDEITRSVGQGSYVLSFWAHTSYPEPTIQWSQLISSPLTDGPDSENWKYYEYIITNPGFQNVSLSIEGIGWIDELRLYPKDASMKTTSFNSNGTVRSECGVNNRVTTYLYDSWKRLEWTLDDGWEILTHNEYHIKDQNDPNDHSWVKEQVVMAEGLTKDDVLNAPPTDENVVTTISYSDGLGRTLQSFAIRQSPLKRDMVSFHQYDALGREPRQYLPFVASIGNDGDYITDPVTEVLDFYDGGSSRVAETAFPYAESEFEASPLSRVLRLGNVGEEWQLNTNHTIKSKQLLNDANEILLWHFQTNGASAMSGSIAQFYPANTLLKTEVEDEHGVLMWEYTNSLGQVVCKRAKVWMTGSGTGSYSWNHGSGQIGDDGLAYLPGQEQTWRFSDTYYVYDEFGRMIYEIPAIATLAFGTNYTFSTILGGTNYSIFDGYMTAQKYDNRGRTIEKKKPGEGWSFYVYNVLNQVILSQSPELSTDDQTWDFVKYDLLGRPIQTGLMTSTLSRSDLQSLHGNLETNLWETKSGNAQAPYSNNAYPTAYTTLLTETYYDDYNFETEGYTYNLSGTPDVAQGNRTRGAVTGQKTMILNGGNDYLLSISYYDLKGRLAVQFSTNILHGYDKVTTDYDYAGKVAKSTRQFFKDGDPANELTIVNRIEYDHAGRPLKTYQQIGSDQEVILSKLVYNELGQVVKKHLHLTDETNVGMQVVDYRYNERGWLTKINNADLVDDGDNAESWDVFGEELIYHEQDRFYSTVMEMKSQFNGNIAAVKWKTNVSPDLGGDELAGHSYVFRYDKLGQMTGAFYGASSDTYIDNYSYRTHMWDEAVSYDPNGNILSMRRKRGADESGNLVANPINMDQLGYSYLQHSNKLNKITDFGQQDWITSERYSHFIDNYADGNEYTYDTEGRITVDLNKELTFEYNHLDLVKTASDGNENVEFTWDATGQKLAKTIGTSTTYYLNGIEYLDNTLTHIATSEGIARNLDGGLNNGDWVYDYYLKDHLGNVRAVITEENSEIISEKVTVELHKRLVEDANFDNVSTTEKDKPYLYPYDPDDPESQKVSELSSYTGKIIGPAKVMAVKTGERIDLSTKYWYTEVPGEPLTSIAEILAGTLLNLGSASSGIIPEGPETGMALLNNVSGNQFGSFSNFINDAFDNVDFSNPQAFIVYMYFDKNMNLDPRSSGIIQVTTANTLGFLSRSNIVPRTDGFFYTYVTNRSEGKVNFDNMTVTRWAPKVRVTYDYYPYGLTWENPAVPNDGNAVHDHCYQDKEFQFSEFTSGHSLALYDFHARMFDPAMGRWLVPDPAAQFANPYLAMGNNPVIGVDPDGRIVWFAPIIIGAAVFGIGNLAIQNSNGNINDFGDGLRAFAAGAIVGAVAGATWSYGLAALNGSAIVGGKTIISGIALKSGLIKVGAWAVLGSKTISTITTITSAANDPEHAYKIAMGKTYLDENRTFLGQTWQGISRYTWEGLQTSVGYNYTQIRNTSGRVDRVDYFGGATFSSRIVPNEQGWGVSIGNYINLKRSRDFGFDIERDGLLQHEYGHTFDSQIFGPLYLFAVGIPSASGAVWSETRADNHWINYFMNHF